VRDVSSDTACPNCGATVVVPKSTRSFICKACDAILKAARTESGFVLKVLGKSVGENPEYQTLESAAAELRAQVEEIHAAYLEEARVKVGGAATLLAIVGFAAVVLGGAFALLHSSGWLVAAAGLVALVVGLVVRSRQVARKRSETASLGAELERLARERDMIEARAAQIRVRT
jgi:hypothetical protein